VIFQVDRELWLAMLPEIVGGTTARRRAESRQLASLREESFRRLISLQPRRIPLHQISVAIQKLHLKRVGDRISAQTTLPGRDSRRCRTEPSRPRAACQWTVSPLKRSPRPPPESANQLDPRGHRIGARLCEDDLPLLSGEEAGCRACLQVADAPTDRRLPPTPSTAPGAGEAFRMNDGDDGCVCLANLSSWFRCSTRLSRIENAATDCIRLALVTDARKKAVRRDRVPSAAGLSALRPASLSTRRASRDALGAISYGGS